MTTAPHPPDKNRRARVATHVQALFLDRDGTLIENRHYIREPEVVAILLEWTEAMLFTAR